MWNEITYPFPHFNGTTIEVWEYISNFEAMGYVLKLSDQSKIWQVSQQQPCSNLKLLGGCAYTRKKKKTSF